MRLAYQKLGQKLFKFKKLEVKSVKLNLEIEIISVTNRENECLDKHNVCFDIIDLECPIKLTNPISNSIKEEDSEDYLDSDGER